jgi:hypothetical protein
MGVKFLHDIREFYADSRVEGGMWNKGNILYKTIYNFFSRQESEQVKQSDGIVCLTYAAEKIIKAWPEYKVTVPLEVIPCSADLELFDYSKTDEKEKAVEVYASNRQPIHQKTHAAGRLPVLLHVDYHEPEIEKTRALSSSLSMLIIDT